MLFRSLVLALLLPAATPLRAQSFSELCRTIRMVRLGQWASYALTASSAQGSTMRLAIIGSETFGDSTYYWYEITTEKRDKAPADRTVMQALVAGLGTATPSVRSYVVKSGDRPALKVPDLMISMMSRQISQGVASETARRCSNGVVVGWETVTVPAGRFRALHVRSADGDAWVTADVPFGMVRVHGSDGTDMILTGRGMDAKSSITEQPQEGMGGRH